MSKILNGREFLAQLLADNLTQEDFEIRFGDGDESDWVGVHGPLTLRRVLEDPVVFRLKPKTRVINGFTVPEPLREIALKQKYYLVNVGYPNFYAGPFVFEGDKIDTPWLNRGLCFDSKEAAIANAKAMCGINPEE